MRETTPTDLDAYLGEEGRDQLLAKRGRDGYDLLLRVVGDLPVEDDAVDSALTDGAAMVALGDESLESLRDRLLRARAAADEAQRRLLGACAWEAAQGASERVLVERSGLARATIRRGLGR